MRFIPAPFNLAAAQGIGGSPGARGHAISPPGGTSFSAMMLRLADASGYPGRIAENGNAATKAPGEQDGPENCETRGDAPMAAGERATTGSSRTSLASPVDTGEETERSPAAEQSAGKLPAGPAEGNPAVHPDGGRTAGDPGFSPADTPLPSLRAAGNAGMPEKNGARLSAIAASATPEASGVKPRKEEELKPGTPGGGSGVLGGSPRSPEIPAAAPASQPGATPDAGALQLSMPTAPTYAGTTVQRTKPTALPQSRTVRPAMPTGPAEVATMQPAEPASPPQFGAIRQATPPARTDARATQPSTVKPPADALPMRPATPPVPADAETVRQTGPAAPPAAGALRVATPAVPAHAGMIASSKSAVSAPAPALDTMPATPQATVESHRAPQALQASAGSAIHPSPTQASETRTEIHDGKDESPVRAPAPQVSESKSVPAGRTAAHQATQVANPLTAILEAPGTSWAATAVPRSTGPVTAPHASPAPASPAPASAAAAFEQMDAAGPPQVLPSAPHRLAVGIHDSSLGWVEIRTHTAEGQISAVLATGSNEARAAAAAYLPEVRDYLAGQQIAVGHLSAETYSASADGHGGPRDGSPGDSGTANQAGATAERSQESFAAESSDEPVSYINVRV
ncbi:MAG: hypothetical protein WA294_18040 [Acidobacteriaceae bacterium]